ncbi:MAG: diaminobutyrate--2-oxoglutarate transaminase [Nitrospinota bacterium]
MKTFEKIESNVRSYCRSFPVVFRSAKGAFLVDENNNKYIDFLCGAGSLNYGHNNHVLKKRLIEYIERNGIAMGLDMASTAKREFLETFESVILKPRGLDYKVQFTGPTGTNGVEAAFKLVRKLKNRTNVIAFTNSFHGVSLGSVAATGNAFYRGGAGTPLNDTTFMPYDGYLGESVDTTEYLRKFLDDNSSGVDHPAAVIVETVQGEGGLNVASTKWLRKLERICREMDILLIVDDIQVGCGRTGTFFSFEEAGIKPDIVVLSKSLSGFGLPMSIVLIRPELDEWKPGEHNGTFRGNNLAFITARETMSHYWAANGFSEKIREKSGYMRERLEEIAKSCPEKNVDVLGRGMIQGLGFEESQSADLVSKKAFELGLIVETCGSKNHVVKCLPPLNIETPILDEGMDILDESIKTVIKGGGDETKTENRVETVLESVK